jgi:hypothetical protein
VVSTLAPPCTYQVKNRFQNVPFKWVNLHRYGLANRKRKFQTIVAEGAPGFSGHRMVGLGTLFTTFYL